MKLLHYPDNLAPGHKLRNYLDSLGYIYTNDINQDVDIVIHWDMNNESVVGQNILDLNKPIINAECRNIKKDFVDRCFKKVFGYSLFLNPKKHFGFAVQKSTRQAVHDAKIIKCPISESEFKSNSRVKTTRAGIKHKMTYQRLIDNRHFKHENLEKQSFQLMRDLRTPIINGDIPLVFLKDKNIQNMFEPLKQSNRHYMECSVEYDVNKIYTEDEQAKIKEFCKMAGVEFADLDILRDNPSGKIYIVDINNIAANSLFRKLTNEDREKSIKIVAKKLDEFIKEKCKTYTV